MSKNIHNYGYEVRIGNDVVLVRPPLYPTPKAAEDAAKASMKINVAKLYVKEDNQRRSVEEVQSARIIVTDNQSVMSTETRAAIFPNSNQLLPWHF